MEVTVKRNGDESADVFVPTGCPLCGGPISLRVSPKGATSVCVPCRWIARPMVDFGPRGLQLAFGSTAEA